jgi:hypothetical protein
MADSDEHRHLAHQSAEPRIDRWRGLEPMLQIVAVENMDVLPDPFALRASGQACFPIHFNSVTKSLRTKAGVPANVDLLGNRRTVGLTKRLITG